MYEGAVQDLIDELGRLPGVGPKSAQRIAFHLLAAESADVTRLVAAGVAADVAQFLLCDIAAGRAEADLRLDLHQTLREPAYVRRFRLQDVEGDPLRALGTDAGQPAQFVDEVLDHAFVQRNAFLRWDLRLSPSWYVR